MRVAIRVDASLAAGTGHVMRCRTLADVLRSHGATIQFICRAHLGNCMAALRADGFEVAELSPPSRNKQRLEREDHAEWLGASQSDDAQETIAALNEGVDWLVVDHYGIGADWQRKLSEHVGQIMVIDDLANRQHICDLLLDQNYVDDIQGRYRRKVPAETKCLLGPKYALLGPQYAALRQVCGPSDGQVRRVFVFFGGTDLDNLTGMVLSALEGLTLEDIAVDVVVGVNNPNHDALASRTSVMPRVRLHRSLPHLADLMAKADLAIGAGGMTTWERCCIGLPSLVVSIAENQKPACEALARDGIIEWAGHYRHLSESSLTEAIASVRESPSQVRRLGQAARALVDGKGAQRVVRQLMAN
ncbi:UDP-2,4-diacetamido-2,4,6-trideoxy-beta-L-altropyranose hydrolase [Spiribacter sp. 218]|uniref:UDP-2,4-diacetamido-2,4, 6-trideoxy-beta-L-altropyranose hydrolase n=1 Tax=Spiribacter pallidus TaxID=1987936 RepID=UPI00349FB18D